MRTYLHRDDGRVDGAPDGVMVCVRRTPLGVLVCSHDPALGDEPRLVDLLDSSPARVICEIRNDPAEPDFDAPVEETARLLIELLDGQDVLVASRDWFAIERAHDAGLATAFISGPGVKVGGGLAYVTAAGHGALISATVGPDSLGKAQELGIELISSGVTAHPVDGVIAQD